MMVWRAAVLIVFFAIVGIPAMFQHTNAAPSDIQSTWYWLGSCEDLDGFTVCYVQLDINNNGLCDDDITIQVASYYKDLLDIPACT